MDQEGEIGGTVNNTGMTADIEPPSQPLPSTPLGGIGPEFLWMKSPTRQYVAKGVTPKQWRGNPQLCGWGQRNHIVVVQHARLLLLLADRYLGASPHLYVLLLLDSSGSILKLLTVEWEFAANARSGTMDVHA